MNRPFRIALVLMFVITLIGPLVHLLKVIRLSADVGAWLFYIGFPLVTSLCILSVVFSRRRITGELAPSIAIMIAVALYSILPTIYYGGELDDIAGNVIRYAFVISVLAAIAMFKGGFVELIDRNQYRIVVFSLASSLIAVVLMHLSALGGFSVYYGLQSTAALLAFAYGLVYRKNAIMLLAAMAILLSGKRGAMFSGVAMTILYLGILMYRGKFSRPAFIAMLVAVTVTVVVVFGWVPPVIADRLVFFSSGEFADVESLTSGRLSEGQLALDELDRIPSAWITGFGLGSAIVNADISYSTIHFSPLAILMQVGLPMVILIYGLMLFSFARGSLRAGSKKVPKVYLWVLMVWVGEFIFSMSAFTALQSYTLWLSYGYLVVARNLVRTDGKVT